RNIIHLCDAITGEEVRTFEGHGARVAAVVFSPDGKRVVSGAGGGVRVWGGVAGGTRRRVEWAGFVMGLAFSPDGTAVFVGTGNHGLQRWELTDGQELLAKPLLGRHVSALALSPDGKTVITWEGVAKSLARWDTRSGKRLREWPLDEALVLSF